MKDAIEMLPLGFVIPDSLRLFKICLPQHQLKKSQIMQCDSYASELSVSKDYKNSFVIFQISSQSAPVNKFVKYA